MKLPKDTELDKTKLRIMAEPLGYVYLYDPKHPLANASGIVYYHRHVMSVHLGRWITSEEIVHHKDENRTNNSILTKPAKIRRVEG